MRELILCFLVVMLSSTAQGQTVTINEAPGINRMMSRMLEINRNENRVAGWRIQILATTDRRKMEDAKDRFLATFPQYAIDWIHAKPYYKLRVGAFETRLEANRLLYRLKRDYPSAYLAKDNGIEPRELVGL